MNRYAWVLWVVVAIACTKASSDDAKTRLIEQAIETYATAQSHD